MVTVMVADGDAIDFYWLYAKSVQPFFQLSTAESLVDQHFCTFGFQQRRVTATASAKVRDAHCHGVQPMPSAAGL